MTEIDKYMKMPYKVELVEDKEEGGFTVSCPELSGCISCGKTIEKAIKNIKDAKREWFSAALNDGIEIPMPDSLNKYSGQIRLRMPKSLHRKLSVKAKEEGISMNQYCIYLLSKNENAFVSKSMTNAIINNVRANKIKFSNNDIIIELKDKRILSVPKKWFPKLVKATNKELENYELIGGGLGIYWEALDEDISVENLILGYGAYNRED